MAALPTAQQIRKPWSPKALGSWGPLTVGAVQVGDEIHDCQYWQQVPVDFLLDSPFFFRGVGEVDIHSALCERMSGLFGHCRVFLKFAGLLR